MNTKATVVTVPEHTYTMAELDNMPVGEFPNYHASYSDAVIGADGCVWRYGDYLAERRGYTWGGLRQMLVDDLASKGLVAR